MKSFLLDTCALIWLGNGNGNGDLSDDTLRAVECADELIVTPVSLWEISNKCRQGKLSLRLPVRDWFNALLSRLSLKVVSPTVDDMIAAGELPEHHKDPADRMIIALALRLNLPVVTKDRNFLRYGVETIG